MSMATRRKLTFLEQQPEVDGMRLGLTGHSMGGELTVLTASDPRVKAATPSVGGSGYLTDELWGLPGSGRQMQHDRDLFNRTVDPPNSWPLIHCPILFLGATNDFNSPMELVIKGFNTLPASNAQRMLAFSTRLNHHFRPRKFASRLHTTPAPSSSPATAPEKPNPCASSQRTVLGARSPWKPHGYKVPSYPAFLAACSWSNSVTPATFRTLIVRLTARVSERGIIPRHRRFVVCCHGLRFPRRMWGNGPPSASH